MKEKVAIITISYGQNLGNKLQNYALETIVQMIGFEVKTIRHVPKLSDSKANIIDKLQYWDDLSGKEIVSDLKRILIHRMPIIGRTWKKNLKKRKRLFSLFDENYLSMIDESDYDSEDFKYLVLGSDQIWNPYGDGLDSFYYQNENSEKVISYAASFGVSSIPDDYYSFYEKMLKNYKDGSVRESDGVKIYNQFASGNAQVVLDPTMLLGKEWDKLCLECEIRKKIVVYFLGLKESAVYKQIKEYARINSLDVLWLNDENAYGGIGPIEFITEIRNAEFVITDSFHGCVFSILFNKNFRVIDRNVKRGKRSMNSRIGTLLSDFEMQDVFVDQYDIFKNVNIDYTRCQSILDKKRKQSMDYLLSKLV